MYCNTIIVSIYILYPFLQIYIKYCVLKDVLIHTQPIQGFVQQKVMHQNQSAMPCLCTYRQP